MDAAVGVAAGLITALGIWDRVALWLPRGAIVPFAVGQGLLLLARRRAPMAVLAAVTLLSGSMLAVGLPTGTAGFATYCAAYAVAVYGRRAGGADLAGTLRGAAAVLLAAVVLAVTAVAAVAPGGRSPSGVGDSFTLGALVAASWVLG